MAQQKRLNNPGQARDYGIGEGHNTSVYGRSRKRRKMLHNDSASQRVNTPPGVMTP
jgi:hypothetical protein